MLIRIFEAESRNRSTICLHLKSLRSGSLEHDAGTRGFSARVGGVLHVDGLPLVVARHLCLEGHRIADVAETEDRVAVLSSYQQRLLTGVGKVRPNVTGVDTHLDALDSTHRQA